MDISNLISLVDAAFIATIIAVVEMIKGMWPKVAESSTWKRIITAAVATVAVVLTLLGKDISIMEGAVAAIGTIITTVGSYALLIKPLLDWFKKRE